jgi:hypothetical protein
MGAGISKKRMSGMIYGRLKRLQRKLAARGLPTTYKNEELRGHRFVIYYAGIGPASNGESMRYLCLRFNPENQPEAVVGRKGDIVYTDFHTRTIPEHDKGGFEAGVKVAIENLPK